MKLLSPKKGQDFIWLAEYCDNTYITEFDLDTCKENSFYEIKRIALIRFGLIGHNLKLFYEVLGGFFNLAGTFVELLFIDDKGKEYHITGLKHSYNDIITYKDAESTFDLLGKGGISGRITKYNFGYKQILNYEDISINARIVFTVPYRQLSYFNFRFVCNKDFKGDLIIKYNNRIKDKIPYNFEANKGYEFNWIMK